MIIWICFPNWPFSVCIFHGKLPALLQTSSPSSMKHLIPSFPSLSMDPWEPSSCAINWLKGFIDKYVITSEQVMASIFVNMFSKSCMQQKNDIKQSDLCCIWKFFLTKEYRQVRQGLGLEMTVSYMCCVLICMPVFMCIYVSHHYV